VELTVKITPRVAAQVARRLRLAASVRSRSMSAMVNDALDEALPSLEEIRMQLAAPAAGEPEVLADIAARHAEPVAVTTARGGPAGTAMGGGMAR
jgi:plasmid stability protein